MNSDAHTRGGSSPSSDLFKRAIDDLDVNKKARDAGVKDQPSPDSTVPDANERQIISYFTDMLRVRRNQCDATLSKLALDRAATSSKIDINQTRASLTSLLNAIQPDLARKKQDHYQYLEIAKDQEAVSRRYLRFFQQEHGLQHRDAIDHPDPMWHFALVAAFAVVEWISLSIFYAEGSDFGLLGGIVMAMALSIINIGLAVFAGAILRYVNHKDKRRKVLAILGATLLTILFLFATGFAAHYRNAARDVAASGNQQQSSSQVMPDQAGQTVHQISGAEDNQWKASMLAWKQFLDHGFVFTDVLSWLLVILAIMFGIIASWKGYGIDDRYPGYGPTSRRYKENKAAYAAEKHKYIEAVDNIFLMVDKKQQDLLRNVRRDIEYFMDLASKSEVEIGLYKQFVQQATQTCNDVIFQYRNINRQVAGRHAPAYFNDQVSLDNALLELPIALTENERPLKKVYNASIQEFTALVGNNYEQLQSLRTAHLDKLADFFDSIERKIDAKLAANMQLRSGEV